MAGGAVFIVLVLVISIISVLIMVNMEPDVEVRSVLVNIEGKEANVSAWFSYSPDADTKNEDLFIRFQKGDVDLNREGDGFWAILDRSQFREIIENETIRVLGKVEVEPIPTVDMVRDVDSLVDLSFLGEILNSVELLDFEISTRAPSTTIVDFDLTVTMSKDVNIYARNTTADIIAGENVFEVDLAELELLSDGTGHGRVEMPTSTLFQLALWTDEVMIDAWGLKAEFAFPVMG
ncbi:MAG: hypothetical protein ACMUHB_05095 [Thermoplasmatota archaeon]